MGGPMAAKRRNLGVGFRCYLDILSSVAGGDWWSLNIIQKFYITVTKMVKSGKAVDSNWLLRMKNCLMLAVGLDTLSLHIMNFY